jgi:ligand-binding sensor domain-containing protein/signal transduction histidine kinase
MFNGCKKYLPTAFLVSELLFALFRGEIELNAAEYFEGPRVFVGKNASGQLELFKVDDSGRLCHSWRRASNGEWSSWAGLGGTLLPGIAIVNNARGEMEIFGVDRATRQVECIHQMTANSFEWSGWFSLGGTFESPVTAAKNADGRLEVFGVDMVTHHVKHARETGIQNGWSDWADFGYTLQPDLVAASNIDGRLELFGPTLDDGLLVHCWQREANTDDWSDWRDLGRAIQPGFGVGEDKGGRVEVFAVSRTSREMLRICQATPGNSTNWTEWQNFGGDLKPELAVGKCNFGRLEVFAVNTTNSMLLHCWEIYTNTVDKWSSWTELGQKSGGNFAVAPDEDDDLEVFAVDPINSSVIHHRRQFGSSNDWLDWSSLDHPVFHWLSRSWQMDDGLPDNSVQVITQTSDGFLWVGTPGGLARFDGSQFSCYNTQNTPALKSSSITALCASKDGTLWIGTDGGGLIHLENGIFSRFTVTNGMAGNAVQVIYESRDGTLWIGTASGMSHFQGGMFHNYFVRDGLLSDVVRCIYEDKDRNLWIATGKGLNRLQPDGTMKAFAMPNGLPNDSVRAICEDQGKRIWIGSNNGLLWYEWYWKTALYAYNTKYGLSDTFVSAICEDDDKNLWVGTYSGLNRFQDGRFYSQFDGNNQPFGKVNVLFTDREGDLWVGAKDGLSRLTPEKFFTYTKQQGLTHNNVTSVLQDQAGNLWAGTWGGGFDELQNEKVTAYASTNGFSQDLILSLCAGRDGSVWAGADFDGGLTRLKNGSITHFTWKDGLLNAGQRVLYEDSKEKLWIGTDRGVSCFDHRQFVTNRLTEHLSGVGIRDICEDHSGALWFATPAGLECWQGQQWIRYTTAEGLSDNSLTALFVDADGTLWIGGAGGGLVRFRNGIFTAYTQRDGLFSDEIFAVIEDNQGWLWMSCSKGVFRVRKRDLDAFDDKKIETIASLVYGKNDGMESPPMNGNGKPSAWKSSDGRLWFPTSKGLVAVNPETIRIDEEPPAVFIETVAADEKTVANGRDELAGVTSVLARRSVPLVVPPGRGELEFQYEALGFSAPEKERFKYRLEGVDSKWINAGLRRAAYYYNLAPGTYHFQVSACNQDGVWNETGASLSVVLLPHYWQTLWFHGLIVVMTVGGACGLVLYATRKRMQKKVILLEQQQAVEKERGRIAKDMHDQIGAGLTQIGLLGEFARRASARNDAARPHAEKICDTARELAQTLDEIVWMVNPRNDTLNKLGGYLAVYAEEFFRITPIRCRLDVPPGLPSLPLRTELRHNVFLTVKDALNNIAKHSQASEVRLRLFLNNSVLEIDVEDDGSGFATETTDRSRNGLSNMADRMKEIGGTFKISSQPKNGTRIHLRIPIK